MGNNSKNINARVTVLALCICRLMLIDICMKFREDSFRGFQVTERTRFVTDRRTDGQTPGEKQYVSQPFGGRHKYLTYHFP